MPVTEEDRREILQLLDDAGGGGSVDVFDPAPTKRYDSINNIEFEAPASQTVSGQRGESDVLSGRDPARMYGNSAIVSQKEVSEISEFLGFTGGLGTITDILKGSVEGVGDITIGTLANILEQFGISIGEESVGLAEIRDFGDYLAWTNDKNFFTSGPIAFIPDPVRDFLRENGFEQRFVDAANGLRDRNDRFMSNLGVRAETEEEQTFFRALGAGGSSLITAVGLTVVTKSPAAAASFFGVVQQSEVYLSAIDAGKNPSESMMIANTAGVIEGALEAIGLGQLFKFMKGGKGVITKGLEGTATEFVQEFSQTASEIGLTDITGVTDIGFKAGVGRSLGSGVVGAFTGGPVGAIGGISGRRRVRRQLTTPGGLAGLTPAIMDAIENENENQSDVGLNDPLTQRGKVGKSDRVIVEEIFTKVQQGIPVKEIFQSPEQQEAAIQAQMKLIDSARRTVGEQTKGRLRAVQRDIAASSESLERLSQEFDVEFAKLAEKFPEIPLIEASEVVLGAEDITEEGIGALLDEQLDVDTAAFAEAVDKSRKLSSLRTKIQEQQANLDRLQEESAGITFGAEETISEISGKEILTKGSVLERIRSSAEIQGFRRGKQIGKKFQRQETQEVQKIVRDFINTLPISKTAKSTLKDRIPKINTLGKLDTALDKIAQSATGTFLRDTRRGIKKRITDTIRTTKVPKRRKGKLTEREQNFFDALRKLTPTGRNKNQQELVLGEALVNFEIALNKQPTADPLAELVHDYIVLQLQELDSGTPDISIFEWGDFLSSINTVRETGEAAVNEQQEISNERVTQLEHKLLKTKGFKDRPTKTTFTEDAYGIFNYLIESYFTNINKYGWANTDMDLRNEDRIAIQKRQAWLERIDDIINNLSTTTQEGTQKPYQGNYVQDLKRDEIVFKVKNPNSDGFRQYTKGEALYFWMIIRNESIKSQFMDPKGAMQWTSTDINNLDSLMTDIDRQFAGELFNVYDEIYEEYNQVYARKYGKSLPKVDFYSHILRFSSQDVELSSITDSVFFDIGRAEAPGSSIERAKQSRAEFRPSNPIDIYSKYVSEVSHYVAYAEKTDIINRALKKKGVGEHLRGVMGKKGFENFQNHLQMIDRSGSVSNQVDRVAEKYRQNFFKVALGFKAKIGVGQLASHFSFKANVPIGAWIRYEAEAYNPANWKRIKATMDQNITIRNRGKNFDPEMAQLGRLGPITKFATMPIRLGDVTAIYLGGWAMYRHLTSDLGMDSTQALKKVADFAERSQQSVMPSNLSLAQKSKSPFQRALVMFKSSPIAMLNVSLQSIHDYKNGPRTLKTWNKMMETLVLQNIIVPVTFNTVALGQKAAFFTGSLVAVPLAGDAMLAVITILFNSFRDEDKERVYAPALGASIFEFTNEIISDIAKASKEEAEFEDWMRVLGDLLEAQWGLPVDNAYSVLTGFGDVANGDIDKGVLEMFGYPKSKVKKLTGSSADFKVGKV